MHVIRDGHTGWLSGGTVSALKEGRDGRQRAFGLVLNRRRERRLGRARVERRHRSEVRFVVVAGGLVGRARFHDGIRSRGRDQIGNVHSG